MSAIKTNPLTHLAWSNFAVRKVRTALTVAAVALSVSLVVAVTSGYKSMEASALRFLDTYIGAADAMVVPANEIQGLIPEKLVKELAADPAVRQVAGRLESERTIDWKTQGRNERIEVNLIGVRRPDDTTVNSLELTSGRWFDVSDSKQAVLDQIAAEKFGLRVGKDIRLPGLHPVSLRIIGIVHKPEFFGRRWVTAYVPMDTLQHFTGEDDPPLVSRISIDLREKSDFDGFQRRWTARLAKTDPNLRLRMRRESAGQLERNLRAVRILSYLGGMVSMLTAMFIIFSAVSMGVSERQRTLAMLRAVGAVRSQVFRLVVFEALILAGVGVVIGIPLGILWIGLLRLHFEDLFSAGLALSGWGMIFGGAGSLLTALAAGMLPAWWASRISPLEAMNPHDAPPARGPPLRPAAVGLLLVCLDPLVFFSPIERVLGPMGFHNPDDAAQTLRFFWHFGIGLPGILVGFFLLAPMFVWIIERLAAPVLAVGLALPIKLLRQQLSTGIWRAAGAAAALMVGLATLIAMQVQGHTLIGGWQLPDRFPDIFIWSPDIISWKEQQTLAKNRYIAPGELMPVVVTTPAGDSTSQLFLASMLSGQDVGFMFFAVDPQQALKMVQLDFRDDQGHPLPREQQAAAAAKAAKEMEKPRHIIVTDEFRQSRHVKIGDSITLMTTVNGPQKYTICGIVWSPGADVIISMYDMSHVLDQRTAGSVFGSIADAKRDFGVKGARLFAANLVGGVDKDKLMKELQKSLNSQGLIAGDVRHIKYGIERAFYRLLDLISTVAVAAMAVACLGVANTMIASVRSRRWQLGILRSIGLGRGDLLRLVLAEAVMLGLVGAALGVVAGLEISVDARQLSGAILGYSPEMQIPWAVVAGGCLSLVAIAVVASLWPAMSVARAQPLELLQAGRAST
jgi:putative ABC transport system permease protein